MKTRFRFQNSRETFDVSEQERIKRVIAGCYDKRVIKPKSMKLSELEKFDDLEGLSLEYLPDVVLYGGEYLPETRKISKGNDSVVYDVEFRPIIPEERKLYHLSGVHDLGSLARKLEERNVFGNPSPKSATYIKYKASKLDFDVGTVVHDTKDSGDLYIASQEIEIDRNELLKTRAIFRDPEGMIFPTEGFGTFIIFGGIPCQAITDYKIIIR